MSVYPNSTRTAAGFMHTVRVYGGTVGLVNEGYRGNVAARLGSRVGLFVATAGQPDGYHLVPVMPRVAGSMAGYTVAATTLDGNLLQGAPLEGASDMAMTSDAELSITVSLVGDGSVQLSAAGGLSLTIGLSGDGTVTLTGSLGLALIVPFEGSAAASLSGAADLKGRLALATGVESTVLTAEDVARAVWAALAASNDLPGSMGELLNVSGAGGLTPTQEAMLTELWRIRGLDPAAPVTVTVTSETAGTIELTITGDGTTTSTLTRQP